jgi:hypothetical protein
LNASGVFPYASSQEEIQMWIRLKHRLVPETLNMIAIIALMGIFAAGVLYEAAAFKGPTRTTQLAATTPQPF